MELNNMKIQSIKVEQNGNSINLSNTMPQILLILLAFCEKNIVRYLILAVSIIPVIGVISNFILPVAYILLILLSVNKKTKIYLLELLIPLFVLVSIMITCLIYPENKEYIFDPNNFWNTIFPCLRWFIVGLIIIPSKKIMNLLGFFSCLAILVESIYLIFYMIPKNLIISDDMSRAYQLLPNILLAFNYAFNNKKLIIWIISFIGFVYIMSLGTRGPFLILIFYILLKTLKTSAKSFKNNVLLTLIIGCLCIVFLVPDIRINLLKKISVLFKNVGLSTRIIDYLLNETVISYTSGRNNLYDIAIEKIIENPIFGYGIYGEWKWFGWNVHNMYLEIILHFGVILGTILLLWGILTVVQTYIKSNNYYVKDLIFIFSCFVFLRGFFGGSYLMFGVFFLLGLCVKEKNRIIKTL